MWSHSRRPARLHFDTTVAVPLEDGAAHSDPAAGIQAGVVLAQVLLFRISSLSSGRVEWIRVLIPASLAGVKRNGWFSSGQAAPCPIDA